jgi:hypothetical protein
VKRSMMIEAIAKRKAAAKIKVINCSIRLPPGTEATLVLASLSYLTTQRNHRPPSLRVSDPCPMDTQNEETPGVAMHRGSCFNGGRSAGRLNHSRYYVWFLQRSRFFMRLLCRELIFRCMLQIYCNGGIVR